MRQHWGIIAKIPCISADFAANGKRPGISAVFVVTLE